MSHRRCAGFLEGTDGIAENVVPEQRLEGLAVYYVGASVKQLADIDFEPGVFEDPHRTGLVEFHQYIDIAVYPGLPACNRSKDGCVVHAVPPQLAFMVA